MTWKTSCNIPSDDQGNHPDDLSISVWYTFTWKITSHGSDIPVQSLVFFPPLIFVSAYQLLVIKVARSSSVSMLETGSSGSVVWHLHHYRADSRFAPSQWETALLCNDVSDWLGASLESALRLHHYHIDILVLDCGIFIEIQQSSLKPLYF